MTEPPAYLGENMDDKDSPPVCTDNPISEPRQRKDKTTAITLRVPIWWIKRLDRIAQEQSFRYQETIRHSDLIREAILHEFIEGLERVPTYRDHDREEKRSDLKAMVRIVRHAL